MEANAAVRQVNARFGSDSDVAAFRVGSPPLTLLANALYVGQVVTWAAAKLPHWIGEFPPALILVGGALC